MSTNSWTTGYHHVMSMNGWTPGYHVMSTIGWGTRISCHVYKWLDNRMSCLWMDEHHDIMSSLQVADQQYLQKWLNNRMSSCHAYKWLNDISCHVHEWLNNTISLAEQHDQNEQTFKIRTYKANLNWAILHRTMYSCTDSNLVNP